MESRIEFFWEDKFAKIERGEPAQFMHQVPEELKGLIKASDVSYRVMLLSFGLGILALLIFAVINNHVTH